MQFFSVIIMVPTKSQVVFRPIHSTNVLCSFKELQQIRYGIALCIKSKAQIPKTKDCII